MAATIKPHPSATWSHKQSRFEHAPELPLRAILLGPSGVGKTVFLVSLILDIYPRCWERIYVVSPTVHLDSQWQRVKDYCRDVLKVPKDELDDCFMDEWDERRVKAILDRQFKITMMSKERGQKKLFGALFICDDVADNPRITRGSTALHELFVRGRHAQLSTVCSVQKYRVLHPLIRVNATDLFVFKLRSLHELEAVVEENSALYGPDKTREIYDVATRPPYSFLWINARAKAPEDTFWLRLEARLVPAESA